MRQQKEWDYVCTRNPITHPIVGDEFRKPGDYGEGIKITKITHSYVSYQYHSNSTGYRNETSISREAIMHWISNREVYVLVRGDE